MTQQALTFSDAAERYGRLFDGTPIEKNSRCTAGVWRLCDAGHNFLGLTYPDGSTVSARTAAILSGR
jgi:hypothetical protein